jgi:hypothetical protein
MRITCPDCGCKIRVGITAHDMAGRELDIPMPTRKPMNMPVTDIMTALRAYKSPKLAADSLGVSRTYLYKVLKQNNLKMKDVLAGS